MNDALSISVATPRFRTLLIGTFAAFALPLAIAGVYGVLAYAVSRRTFEIGVRMAMGAASVDILRLVMAQGLRLALTGIAIGCALAYGLSQLLRGTLFAVTPAHPIVFIGVPLALLATAAAATAIPALRASRVNPIQALHHYCLVNVIVLVSNGGVQLLDDTPIGPVSVKIVPAVTVIVPVS